MNEIEHPDIKLALKTGYSNMISQSEHAGIDYFGDEILVGDVIVTDCNTGEVVLKENLEKYLHSVYDFQFTTAE